MAEFKTACIMFVYIFEALGQTNKNGEKRKEKERQKKNISLLRIDLPPLTKIEKHFTLRQVCRT